MIFSLRLALRFFLGKKKDGFISFISFFSLLGITIGVAALIVVMSVMNGFREELTSNILGLHSDMIISARSHDGRMSNYQEIVTKLKTLPYVKSSSPAILGQGLVTGPRESVGAVVKGLKVSDLNKKREIVDHIISGSLQNFTDKSSIIIGQELAFKLGVRPGDFIKIMRPKGVAGPFGSMPQVKDFEVIATFNSGMYDFDTSTVIMNLETAQSYFMMGDSANAIEVYTLNPMKANKFANFIRAELGEDYVYTTWLMLHSQFLKALDIERVAMFVILSLIVLVAAFNIISSLFMLVKEKNREIAILRTIGMSKTSITQIFIICGSITGILGTFLGAFLGVSIASNIEGIRKFVESVLGFEVFSAAIYFLYQLPSKTNPSDVFFVVMLALALSFLATIYPAVKASNIDPIKILRNE